MNKLQQDHQVYIPVDDQVQEDRWVSFLSGNGIPLTNFHFLHILTETAWTRDYGPCFVWDANNEMGVVNYTCYHGYWDDRLPESFAALYGINYYESGLRHVGGNFYPGAYGRAFSSTHVYESNPTMTKAELDATMESYFGIENYHTIAPKDICHHDTWAKPANPETLIVADFPEYDVIRHAQAEDTVAHYSSLESPWGRPYRIHRFPMMSKAVGQDNYRPYLNCLISNKQVFVPVHNHADDAIAIGVFQGAFPGYEVIGVLAENDGWLASLHCRTRNFVKREQIRLYPFPPGDTEETGAGYPVTAEVTPPNGSALLGGYPVIHWTTTGGVPFAEVVMAPTGQPDEYTAEIPLQPLDTTVSFYIEARDDGSRETIYPLVAPDGMMTFQVREDSSAPVISRHVPLRSASATQWPATVRTLCKDDMTTPEVKAEYSINGVPQVDVSLSREDICYWYSEALAGTVSPGDVVSYRLVATDNAASPNEAIMPRVGSYFCPVSGPGSIAVVDLCSRPYTTPFLLDALGDLGIPYHHYDAWPTDWSLHDIWFICLGLFADNYVLSASEAANIVTALQAGNHIYLEGGNTWCDDPEKGTLNQWFGVQEGSSGEDMKYVSGAAGSLVEGLTLKYAGEDLLMDVVDAVSPAERLFASSGNNCRAVIQDAGSFRTIASAFSLGGLLDGDWPETRKEILVRYLEFFGVDIGLYVGAEARIAMGVPVSIKGDPGDLYQLLGSWAEGYRHTGYGTLRLDSAHLSRLRQGVIPASGVAEFPLRVPGHPGQAGFEFHLQAVVGEALNPIQAQFTNREILTLRE